jgi:hypothetical protein
MSAAQWSVDQKVLFESVGLHISDNAKLDAVTLLAIAQQPSAALSLRSLLDHDLNAFGRGFTALGTLSGTGGTGGVLAGPFFVQIDALDDAATPKRQVEVDADDHAAAAAASMTNHHRRCLRLRLTDGAHKFDALEFASLADSVDFERTPPGTKLVLRNVRNVRGWLLLTPDCVQVLGGTVEALVKVFRFNRAMALRERSLARHSAARDPGDPGPPQFTLPVNLHSPPPPAVAAADVDTRLPPGLDVPANTAAQSTTTTTSQARPSAKQKGKFAPMPAVNRAASTASNETTAAAAAAPVATNASKFAPMPTTNRSADAAAAAPKQKGKFAPMPAKKSDTKQANESK